MPPSFFAAPWCRVRRPWRKDRGAPWFAYYLKDKGRLEISEAITVQTGGNEWKSYDQWPPRNLTTDRKLYFQGNGRLAFDTPPTESQMAFDEYVSDPANPVPYRPRPIEPVFERGSGWSTSLINDQRFVHRRPDVLSWETETLTEDVVITGHVLANLFASTTGTDSDWVAKLIDVYPEDYAKEPSMGGYQLMMANDVLRGRFRESFERPRTMTPNKIESYKINLHHINHRFRKGHKIMVQVQSTLFPVIDRNPQKYVPNIFKAKESDYIKARQRIFRSRTQPSHLLVPWL